MLLKSQMRVRRVLFLGAWMAALFLAAPGPCGASTLLLTSTFDTDNEGWSSNGGGILSYVSGGGNPGGFLREDDTVATFNYGVLAPAKFLGDLSAFDGGTLAFDARIIATGTNVFDDTVGLTIITSPSGIATRDLISGVPSSAWQTFSAPMTASAWGKTQSEWTAILANVTKLEIQIEAFTGPDATGFDNAKLVQSVPEPSSLTLLGIASASMLGYNWRRRKATA